MNKSDSSSKKISGFLAVRLSDGSVDSGELVDTWGFVLDGVFKNLAKTAARSISDREECSVIWVEITFGKIVEEVEDLERRVLRQPPPTGTLRREPPLVQ